MRKEFCSWIEKFAAKESRVIFLTGDLGYSALEEVQKAIGERFVNMGVCEQNMVTVAAGLAQQGLMPVCYSIAPFMVFRPFEQIRLDVSLHKLNVKIVGNGAGYGYGVLGSSHHALEDLATLSALQNFVCLIPVSNSDVDAACEAAFDRQGPTYLRLGFGAYPDDLPPLGKFLPIRRLLASSNGTPQVTICGLGPTVLNLFPWIKESGVADVFAVSQLPLSQLSEELVESVNRSGLLWVVEEHVARGGIGEHLAAHLARLGVHFRLVHSHAAGYPSGLYGSQKYHQRESGLDSLSLQGLFQTIQSPKE